jgi:pimeloyl-ACP methyl ester carboxylesterase
MSGPVNHRRHVVETPAGITIQVRARGEENRGLVVLLLHGLGVGSGYWDLPVPGFNTMDYLAEQGVTVYAMDHRGYGGSGPVPGDTVTISNALEDVQAVLDFVVLQSPQRPVALVGHSWGGMVAVAVAAAGAHDLTSLVTIGTPFRRVHPAFEERLPLIRASSVQVDGWISNQTHLELDQRLFAYDEVVLHAYQQLVESEYPRIPMGIIDDCASMPHTAAVQQLRLPTLLIYGTLELVVDRADCLEFLDALPAAEKDLLIVGNSGHLMCLEKLSHSHVDRAIAGWLLEHASFRGT